MGVPPLAEMLSGQRWGRRRPGRCARQLASATLAFDGNGDVERASVVAEALVVDAQVQRTSDGRLELALETDAQGRAVGPYLVEQRPEWVAAAYACFWQGCWRRPSERW